MKSENGVIQLDFVLKEIGIGDISSENDKIKKIPRMGGTSFSFAYQKKLYFYKDNPENPLLAINEIIASYLAKDFQIPFVEYQLAQYQQQLGVLSRDFRKPDTINIKGTGILMDFWKTNYLDTFQKNYLEGIWVALEDYCKNYPNRKELVKKLMNQLIHIFVFDILIRNNDRFSENWFLEVGKEDINIGPVFDNERMLAKEDDSLGYYVQLTTLEKEEGQQNIWEAIQDFQDVSSQEYTNLLQDKLWIISRENIISIFDRMQKEMGYEIPNDWKAYYLVEFENHKQKIERILKQERREDFYERKN